MIKLTLEQKIEDFLEDGCIALNGIFSPPSQNIAYEILLGGLNRRCTAVQRLLQAAIVQ